MNRVPNRPLAPALADTALSDKPAVRKAPSEGGQASSNPLANETARRMLEVAERLFAENGIEMVPLRQIMVEAGQRNRSALHYHFGSRETLVSQLLNFRLHDVDMVRNRYLNEVEEAGLQGDVRAIMEASISALIDTICHTPWGARYVQVLAQTTFSPRLLNAEMVDSGTMSGVLRARRMFAAALPDIPRKVLHNREQWLNHSIVYSLAQWCHQTQSRRGPSPLADLVDCGTAVLTAPIGKPRMVSRSRSRIA